jgi:hypothetical protein
LSNHFFAAKLSVSSAGSYRRFISPFRQLKKHNTAGRIVDGIALLWFQNAYERAYDFGRCNIYHKQVGK